MTSFLPGLSPENDEMINNKWKRRPELLTGRSNMTIGDQVAFHALRFAPPILELGNKLADMIRNKGSYLAHHPRIEKDVWVHRAYAGHKKYITLNKRHMLPYFLNSSFPEAAFNNIIKELHGESVGQPELRAIKAEGFQMIRSNRSRLLHAEVKAFFFLK